VHLGTFSSAVRVMGSDPTRWRPQTRETADHSLPYVLACALQFGTLEPAHFDEEMLHRPELIDLMQKVTVELSPEAEAAWPEAILNIVTVERTDGASYTAQVPYYLGHYKRPMSDQDLEAKFRRVTGGLLSPGQQDDALAIIWRLEELDDVGELMASLVV
jgi:2-methylcitrate dehydratase